MGRRNNNIMKTCHRCHRPWKNAETPGFNNTCEGCGNSLHCCANCDYYRPRASVRCGLPGTEQILDANASNQCRQFEFLSRSASDEYEEAAGDKTREFLTAEEGQGESDAGETNKPTWDQLFS